MRTHPTQLLAVSLLLVWLTDPASLRAGVDLGRIYKATLTPEKRPQGKDWKAEEADVWKLARHVFSSRDALRVELGPSNVVFGRHGTNVLWAVVIPEAPGKLVAAPAGKGEEVTSVFLRFHPGLVSQLFPAASVIGNGPAEALILARRIYQHKIARVVDPNGPWTYTKPVAVLCGERTMSSAESFVCMMAVAPNVTLIGDRTAGSSANPRQLELPGKIRVDLPRWLDLDHTGKPIDRVGVQPDVKVDVLPDKYTDSDDPVVRAALRHLQKG